MVYKKRVAYFTDMRFAYLLLALAGILGGLYFWLAPDPVTEIAGSAAQNRQIAKPTSAQAAATTTKTVNPVIPDGYKRREVKIRNMGHNFAERDADIVIDKKKDYQVLLHGKKVGEVWKGPADLSMKIWIAYNANELIFQFDVVDDAHVQPADAESASTMYNDDSIQLAITSDKWQSQWEFGFARTKDGKVLRHCWIEPSTPKPLSQEAVQEVLKNTQVTYRRIDDKIERFYIKLPLNKLQITKDMLVKEGIRINAIYNDTDSLEERRKGWIEVAPGIGQTKENTAFALIKFVP